MSIEKFISWLLALLAILFPFFNNNPKEIADNEPPFFYNLNESPVEPLPGELAHKDFDYWLTNADNYYYAVIGNPSEVFLSANSSSYAWSTSYIITALYKTYCFTGNIKYLEAISMGLDMMFSTLADADGDGFLNWGCTEYSQNSTYEEYCVHSGVILMSISEYLCLIKGDTQLYNTKISADNRTYGEQAEELIAICCNHIIAAFDKDWSEDLGLYMNRPGSSNFGGRTQAASLPNNQYLSMAAALYGFAKINPSKSEQYLQRADRMIKNFKNKMIFYDNNTAKWFYNNSFFKGDASENIEDYSHSMLSIKAMIAAYNRGATINLGNLRSVAKTYETTMAKGSIESPALSYNVDGGGEPIGRYTCHLFDLQSFGSLIWQRGERYLNYASQAITPNSAYVLIYHPDAPSPEKPQVFIENGAKISADFYVLNWSATMYASDYCLQISLDENFTNLVVDRPYIQQNNAILTDLPEDANLYLRIIARNESGRTNTSDTFTVTTLK